MVIHLTIEYKSRDKHLLRQLFRHAKTALAVMLVLVMATTSNLAEEKNTSFYIKEVEKPYKGTMDGDMSGFLGAIIIPGDELGEFGSIGDVITPLPEEPVVPIKSSSDEYEKVRVIAMTDGEGDDRSSMVRFLLYANEMDIEAIIQTNSYYQIYGHSKNTGDTWLEKHIDAYESVLGNLLVHDSGYPSADYLREAMYIGDEDPNHVKRDKASSLPPFDNTDGSDRIIEVLLDEDPRPVWVQAWGGTNTLAQALYELKYSGNYSDAMYEKAIGKLRIHAISFQDDSGEYIEDHFPDALLIKSYAFAESWGYNNDQGPLLGKGWVSENIADHGFLADRYIKQSILEGDTPSFLNAIANGLGGDVNPLYGGWGGQFYLEKASIYRDLEIDGDRAFTINKYVEAAQNDFAARLDWSNTNDYAKANHEPVAVIDNVLNIEVTKGESLTISAKDSYDNDGDSLEFKWQQNKEASTYKKAVVLSGSNTDSLSVDIPTNISSGATIHFILEVKDDGVPAMVSYLRIILTMK